MKREYRRGSISCIWKRLASETQPISKRERVHECRCREFQVTLSPSKCPQFNPTSAHRPTSSDQIAKFAKSSILSTQSTYISKINPYYLLSMKVNYDQDTSSKPTHPEPSLIANQVKKRLWPNPHHQSPAVSTVQISKPCSHGVMKH